MSKRNERMRDCVFLNLIGWLILSYNYKPTDFIKRLITLYIVINVGYMKYGQTKN